MSDIKMLVAFIGISIIIGTVIGLIGSFIGKIKKNNTKSEHKKEYDIRKLIRESTPYGYSDTELYNLLFANKEQKMDKSDFD